MNNTQPWQNTKDSNSVSNSLYPNYTLNESPNYQTFRTYQPHSSSTSRLQTFDGKYNSFNINQPTFKQRNKAMYSSTMNLTSYHEMNTTLGYLGRKVNEGLSPKGQEGDTKNQMRIQKSKYDFLNKYTSNQGRQAKMASSAIFQNSNNQKEDQFNRFPSFNLAPNLKPDAPYNIKIGADSGMINNSNETGKNKKQVCIETIKRNVQQLNKKMLNRPITTISENNFKPRSNRSSAISQSAIFDTSNYQKLENQFRKVVDNKKEDKKMVGNQTTVCQDHLSTISNQGKQFSQINYEKRNKSGNGSTRFNPSAENTKDFNKMMQYQRQKFQEKKDSITPYTPYQYKSKLSNLETNTNYSDQSSKQSSDKTKILNSFQQKPSIQNYASPTGNKYLSSLGQHNFSKTDESEQSAFKKKKIYDPNLGIREGNKIELMKTYPAFKEAQFGEYNTSKYEINKKNDFKSADKVQLNEAKGFKIEDFVLGRKMGKGQFGQVLLVRHKLTGWLCGLKVMQKKQIREMQYAQQIARQLSIQFYLEHRNVAQLYGYFQDQKKFYLLIQFCTGGQLLQKIRSEKRMNEKDVSKIIRQVCEGIDYIHKQLIIHRDLKPENILFNFGTAKISDFGWAVYRGFGLRKTASGSPLYYPPEIVKGEQYDDKIDVWNIGMMTYECLLGKIPFRVYSQLDLGRIVSDQITFPQYVDVSNEAKDFILKTMKKKGDQRMQIRQMLRHPFLVKSKQVGIGESISEQFKRVLQ